MNNEFYYQQQRPQQHQQQQMHYNQQQMQYQPYHQQQMQQQSYYQQGGAWPRAHLRGANNNNADDGDDDAWALDGAPELRADQGMQLAASRRLSLQKAVTPLPAPHLGGGGGGAFDDGGPLLRWNGSQWAAAPGLGSSGGVNALVAFNGVVVVGGEFAAVPAGSGGGPPSSNIASWDGQAWGNLNGAAAAGLNGPVYTMYAHPVGVVVGGSFTHAGDQNLWSPNIAFLIPNFGWQGLWPGTDGPVYASSPGPSLDSDPSWVYVGGNFAHAGGVAVGNIAVYNGTGWFALASGTDGPVYSLVAFGLDALYAGGDFQHAGGVTVNNLARWDGAVWTAVAGGTDSAIWALSRLAATLVAAGSFGLAGSTSVACVAQVQPGSDGALWSDAGLPAHVGTPCNVTATFSAGWAVWG